MKKEIQPAIPTGLFMPKLEAPKNKEWEGWTKRVCIAVPTTGNIRIEWMMARFSQIIPCNWSNADIFQYFDQYSPIGWAVAEARNICLKYFMDGGYDWLIFIDHDTLIPPDCFIKLNEYMNDGSIPIISGLYYCKGSHPEPLIYRGRGNSFYQKWKAGDKVWCDGIPMGCCLIHKSIIKRLYDTSPEYVAQTNYGQQVCRQVFVTPREAWFDNETGRYQSQSGTEDLYFLDRVIKEKVFENCGVKKFAKYGKMKYPFLLDTSIFCSHIDNYGNQYGHKEYTAHKKKR